MVLARRNLVVKYEQLHPEVKDAVDALRRNRGSRLRIAGASALAMGVTKPLVYGRGGLKTALANTFGASVAGLIFGELFSGKDVEEAAFNVGVLVRRGRVFKDQDKARFRLVAANLPKRYKFFFVNGDGHLIFTNKPKPFLVGRKRELTH